MRTRRQFIQLTLPTILAAITNTAAASDTQQVYMPVAQGLLSSPTQTSTPDALIIGPASGTVDHAVAWLTARSNPSYTAYDIGTIVACYRDLGEWAGVDWFLAVAQMAHETGSLTSWWSQRPRRNPAGIGVTGRTQTSSPQTGAWAWDERAQLWREGVSFPSWDDQAIPAHLGRLLAYAVTDDAANDAQRQLIDYAMLIRPLPASYRGVAPTITGLNGRWAVPGKDYGQRIMDLARRMAAA